MELKQIILGKIKELLHTFNRTFMELKRFGYYATEQDILGLLIAPLWN